MSGFLGYNADIGRRFYRVDCVVVYEKGLIWFEGMSVVVCESGRLRAFFICLVGYAETYEFEIKDVKLLLYFN